MTRMVRLDQLADEQLTPGQRVVALEEAIAVIATLLCVVRRDPAPAELDGRIDSDGMLLVPVEDNPQEGGRSK